MEEARGHPHSGERSTGAEMHLIHRRRHRHDHGLVCFGLVWLGLLCDEQTKVTTFLILDYLHTRVLFGLFEI